MYIHATNNTCTCNCTYSSPDWSYSSIPAYNCNQTVSCNCKQVKYVSHFNTNEFNPKKRLICKNVHCVKNHVLVRSRNCLTNGTIEKFDPKQQEKMPKIDQNLLKPRKTTRKYPCASMYFRFNTFLLYKPPLNAP